MTENRIELEEDRQQNQVGGRQTTESSWRKTDNRIKLEEDRQQNQVGGR